MESSSRNSQNLGYFSQFFNFWNNSFWRSSLINMSLEMFDIFNESSNERIHSVRRFIRNWELSPVTCVSLSSKYWQNMKYVNLLVKCLHFAGWVKKGKELCLKLKSVINFKMDHWILHIIFLVKSCEGWKVQYNTLILD